MKHVRIVGTLALSLALAACGGGNTTTPPPPPPSPAAPDTSPPTIVSVSPSSGATGVAKDANIVVTFSEAMNQASAQAAFQSSTIGATTINWNAAGTEMTVNPNADLDYTTTGKTYSYSITTTATDKAGNALASNFDGSFKTFKRISTTITATQFGEISNAQILLATSVDIQVGDQINNTSRRGFVGFDLSSLPADLIPANVEVARVKMFINSPIQGTPFTDLFPPSNCSGTFCILLGKSVVLEHVNFGATLTGSAYETTPISTDVRGLTDDAPCLTFCLIQGTTTGLNSDSVLEWVRDDLTNKASRGNRSQLRIRFPIATNSDNASDFIAVSTVAPNKPFLAVTYLIP